MPRISAILSTIATTLLLAASAGAARADTVVQVPLPGLLDGRSVTTLTGGKIVAWTVPTDGGGLQNAFATAAVATMQGAPVANALPDDGRFVADARHPEVLLNFSNNADAASPQAHLVKPSGTFTFAMPPATYSKLFLFFSGAAGGTTLKITLTYADGSTEIQTATVPDYYATVPATDPVIFNLASNLAKWNKNTQIAEANHHNITGVELHPMAGKTLTGIQVDRGPNGYLLFWGATGLATSPVDAGTVASGTSSDASIDSESGASGGDASTSGATTGASSGAVSSTGMSGGATAGSAATSGTSSGTTGTTGTTGNAAAGAMASAGTAAPSSLSASGCSCSAAPSSGSSVWPLFLAACGMALRRRRRRDRDCDHHSARHGRWGTLFQQIREPARPEVSG